MKIGSGALEAPRVGLHDRGAEDALGALDQGLDQRAGLHDHGCAARLQTPLKNL